MSYDFAIWKRAESAKTAMLAEVYAAVCDDRSHLAMAPFDLPALESVLKAEFGDYSVDADLEILCYPGQTESVCWMIVASPYSAAGDVHARLVPIVLEHGLLLYDPQRKSVVGNKRPPCASAATTRMP
ncbi:hypothetical protein [Pseudomarimonas arenosa]|uniref:Uncharacterized protein n=1 Tax=Pseudomarimonas arenosa TaxID=2774145 RepID=A0AAW3ZQF0_9GAMM|nr:hypothetical protein [Pseudomarimonas arenosa]MBD8528178.1 hypothetical protein [Pseudomarimonas arenosa]